MTESRAGQQADKAHILVIDDDDRIRALVSRYLQQHDFVTVTARDAAQARDILARLAFDALVVDIMMPGETGLAFVKKLRDEGGDVPVLFLTALGEAEDRISGFEHGGDDYLPKPFEPRELLLRVQALLRRRPQPQTAPAGYQIGPWRYDLDMEELDNGQEILRLTAVESQLLRALVKRAGEAVSREELADSFEGEAGERTIDVQVTRLRKKLGDDPKAPRYLQTVRGKGYLLRAEVL